MIPIFILFMMYDITGSPEDILQLPARYLIIFVLGAVLMIWPRWKARRASGMVYAVTDSRLLIAEGGRARSFGPDALSVILRRDHGNGLGNLTFGDPANQISARPQSWFTSEYEHDLRHRDGFFGIEDIESAEAAAFKWVHYLLVLGAVVTAIAGILLLIGSGIVPISVFVDSAEVDRSLVFRDAHWFFALGMVVLLIAHVAGGILYQRRHGQTFGRMRWPRQSPEPRDREHHHLRI